LAARARRQAALDAKDGSNAGYNAGYDGSNAGYDGSNAGYGGEDDDYGYGEYDDLHPDVEEKLDSMAEKVGANITAEDIIEKASMLDMKPEDLIDQFNECMAPTQKVNMKTTTAKLTAKQSMAQFKAMKSINVEHVVDGRVVATSIPVVGVDIKGCGSDYKCQRADPETMRKIQVHTTEGCIEIDGHGDHNLMCEGHADDNANAGYNAGYGGMAPMPAPPARRHLADHFRRAGFKVSKDRRRLLSSRRGVQETGVDAGVHKPMFSCDVSSVDDKEDRGSPKPGEGIMQDKAPEHSKSLKVKYRVSQDPTKCKTEPNVVEDFLGIKGAKVLSHKRSMVTG
jgi:hypothetical protein